MSISRMKLAVPCPNCGAEVAFSLLSTIDAGRDPESRAEILDRTLQQEPCGVCGTALRPPPAFMYFDRRCNLWISAHAWSERAVWGNWEKRAQTNFQTVYESGSSIGKQMHAGPVHARVTFGWEALREKIIAAEHNIDDVRLEACKHHRAKAGLEPYQVPGVECRLLSASRDQVILARIAPDTEKIIEETCVRRPEFEKHMQAAAADTELRERLEQGLFVDVERLAIASA